MDFFSIINTNKAFDFVLMSLLNAFLISEAVLKGEKHLSYNIIIFFLKFSDLNRACLMTGIFGMLIVESFLGRKKNI